MIKDSGGPPEDAAWLAATAAAAVALAAHRLTVAGLVPHGIGNAVVGAAALPATYALQTIHTGERVAFVRGMIICSTIGIALAVTVGTAAGLMAG